jgi:hypothetical protein
MITTIILLLVFLPVFAWNKYTDYFHQKSLCMRFLVIAILWWFLFQLVPVSSFLIAYAMGSACYLSGNHFLDNFCTGKNGVTNYHYISGVSYEFINLLCLAILFLLFPNSLVSNFFDMIPLITIGGAITTFFPLMVYAKPVKKKIPMYGLGSNISINGALMSCMAMASLACSIPYLGLVGYIAGASATFKAKGSSGIGGIILGSTIYWSYSYPIVVASVCGIILLTLPLWWERSVDLFGDDEIKRYKIFGIRLHPIFYSAGRIEVWKQAYNILYKPYAHKLFGIGNGAFKYAFPILQINARKCAPKSGDNCFIFIHNDVYQWWIEGGNVGALLLIASLGELFFLGYNDPFFMGFIACLLVNSIAYFSFSMIPEKVLAIMAIKRLLI